MSATQTLKGQRETAAPARTDTAVDLLRRAALTDPVTVQHLRGNLHLITGAGGNVVLLDEPDGALLVDSAIAGARVEAAVASVTAAPIRYLVNTHWHFDHTDGNEWIARHGADIIAQENTRLHLRQVILVEDYDVTFPPVRAAALPRTVFGDQHAVMLGNSSVWLRHYDPGHTDSDLSVRFGSEDVFQVGDTWWNGIYPFIDYSTGGSIDGLIAAAEWNLGVTSRGTLIVPGHGPAGDRDQLRAWYDMLVAIREEVAQLKARGFARQEVLNARPTAPFDGLYGKGPVGPEFFTWLVYRGV